MTLKPSIAGAWGSDMIEYGHIFGMGKSRYIFYNGNGFGKSGIGIASASNRRVIHILSFDALNCFWISPYTSNGFPQNRLCQPYFIKMRGGLF